MDPGDEKETLKLKLKSLSSLLVNLKKRQNSPEGTINPPQASNSSLFKRKTETGSNCDNSSPIMLKELKAQASTLTCERVGAGELPVRFPTMYHWKRSQSSPSLSELQKDRMKKSFSVHFGECNSMGYNKRDPFKLDSRRQASTISKHNKSFTYIPLAERQATMKNKHSHRSIMSMDIKNDMVPKVQGQALSQSFHATGESKNSINQNSQSNLVIRGCSVKSPMTLSSVKQKEQKWSSHNQRSLTWTKSDPSLQSSKNKWISHSKGVKLFDSPTIRQPFSSFSSKGYLENKNTLSRGSPMKRNYATISKHRIVNKKVLTWKNSDFKKGNFRLRRTCFIKNGKYKLLYKVPKNHRRGSICKVKNKYFSFDKTHRKELLNDTKLVSARSIAKKVKVNKQHKSHSSLVGQYSTLSASKGKGGTRWKAQQTVIHVEGVTFTSSSRGRTLKRLTSAEPLHNDMESKKPKLHLNGFVYQKRQVASHLLRRSIMQLTRFKVKKAENGQYCKYYNRFGKCRKQDTCPFIHDPDKIAICTRFLQGKCTDAKCLFSHKAEQHKLPTCSFFLRAACSRENCPYAHVKVSRSALVCEDFLRGFCPKGEECKKKHILHCEEFQETGKCSKGKACKLLHRSRKYHKRRRSSSDVKVPKFIKRNAETPRISLAGLDKETSTSLQIRPKVLMETGSSLD